MKSVTWSYKLILFIAFAAVYYPCYLLPNFHPLSPPALLPLLPIDLAVPLVPWTFVVYLSDYLFSIVAIILIRDWERWHAYARMSFLALFLCGATFLLFPTTYPRPIYPEVTNPLVAATMRLIAGADTPNNCLPSMHVAVTCVALWNLRDKSRPVVAFFTLWSLAIIVSTMTTKQHYFVDILGGLSVTAFVVWFDWAVASRGWFRQALPIIKR